MGCRYLVLMDAQFKSVCRYFGSLWDDDLAGHDLLVKFFPRLVMTVAKRPALAFDSRYPVVDLDCTVCKPISVSALLRVCATRKFRCVTTYFGAEVSAPSCPPFVDEGWGVGNTLLEERIARISLQVPGEITGSATHLGYGGPGGGKDVVFAAESDGGSWSRCEVKESLRTLFDSIPRKREAEGEPYYMEIRGFAVSDLQVVADVVSLSFSRSFDADSLRKVEAMDERVCLKIPVYPLSSGFSRADTLAMFEQHLTAIADKYAERWDRLHPIESEEVLLRAYYEEIVRRDVIDLQDVQFAEDCVVVGTLETRRRFPEDADGEGGSAEGFELVVRRFAYDDWLREEEYEEVESEEVLRKAFWPGGGVEEWDEGEETSSGEDTE